MSDITVWGIDLGTTYSAIGRIDPLGRPEVIQNREGQYTTPSVVLFEPGTGVAVVGQEAKNEAVQNPERVVEFVKRSMGQDGWTKEVDGREYRPEEISALILRKLAEDAEEGTGESVQNVVITVPAYFNDLERAATENAGQLAGLNVLDVLNEPTAAAIYYSKLEEEKGGTLSGNVLVYDLGGGTFDITVIKVSDEGITVVVTDGNHSLGGKDWDDALIRYVAGEFQAAYGVDPLDDMQSLQELRVNCENAKRSLSNRDAVKVSVSCQGQHGSVEVTLEVFDDITGNLLAQTIELTQQCVSQAAERGAIVDEVLLVGGSSRMKQVASAVRDALGKEPRLFEPDMAVAKGATIKAAWDAVSGAEVVVGSGGPAFIPTAVSIPGITAEKVGRVDNVASHSLGTILHHPGSGFDDEIVEKLIEKQTQLPADARKTFYTVAATDQIRIRVVQGEDANPAECTLLTEQTVHFSRMLPEQSPIELEYRLNEKGMLEVTATDLTDGVRTDFVVERIGVMGAEEIDQARADIAAVELRQ